MLALQRPDFLLNTIQLITQGSNLLGIGFTIRTVQLCNLHTINKLLRP